VGRDYQILHNTFPSTARYNLGPVLLGSGVLKQRSYSVVASGRLLAFVQRPLDEACDPQTEDDCTRLLVVWDLLTDSPRVTITAPAPGGVALVMDNTHLAARYDDRTDFYNLETGAIAFTVPVSLTNFSPDGFSAVHRVDGAENTTAALAVWEFGLREEIMRLTFAPGERVGDVVFSDDGSRLAVSVQPPDFAPPVGSFTVDVWDVRNGTQMLTIDDVFYSQQVALSPDNRYALVYGSSFWVGMLPNNLYDLDRGGLRWTVPGQRYRGALDVAFRGDGGEVVIVYADGRLQRFDTATGDLLEEIRGYPGYAVNAHFTDDAILINNDEGETFAWDSRTFADAEIYEDCSLLAYHAASDTALCREGYIVNDTFFQTLATGERVSAVADKPDGEHLGIVSAAFHPDGETLAFTGTDGTVYRADVGNGEVTGLLSGEETQYPFGVQFTEDGRYLAAGGTGTVFDAQTWEIVAQPIVAGANHSNFVFSEAGDWFAFPATDGNIYIWRWRDLLDGSPVSVDTALAVLEGTDDNFFGSYTTLADSPDGRLLVVAGSEATLIYEAETFTEIARIQDSGDLLRFSPDGRQVVLGTGYCYVCGADGSYQIGTARVYGVRAPG